MIRRRLIRYGATCSQGQCLVTIPAGPQRRRRPEFRGGGGAADRAADSNSESESDAANSRLGHRDGPVSFTALQLSLRLSAVATVSRARAQA